jgi:hypothetical protein
VDVLHDDHYGAAERERREEGAPRAVDRAANDPRLELAKRDRGVLDPHGVGERGGRAHRVGRDVLGQQRAPGAPDLGERRIRRIAVQHPRVSLEDLRERPVRHAVPVGEAPAARHERPRTLGLDPREELGDEPALADAGIAVDGQEMRPSFGGGSLEQRPKHIQLPIPADYRGLQAGDAAIGRHDLLLHDERLDRLGLSLQDE